MTFVPALLESTQALSAELGWHLQPRPVAQAGPPAADPDTGDHASGIPSELVLGGAHSALLSGHTKGPIGLELGMDLPLQPDIGSAEKEPVHGRLEIFAADTATPHVCANAVPEPGPNCPLPVDPRPRWRRAEVATRHRSSRFRLCTGWSAGNLRLWGQGPWLCFV